ncbi:2-dehydro-3-deoxygalactonokinase [Enterovirga sp. CN4-39]|uniref:2-dehydro-3-deoxygalactonokinase n=1 Tax=Enterovirga sp. CN4-39 TaxID=3400910 RepID=UPI003C00A4A4
MRFVAVDWGTSRIRALLVDGAAILARSESDEGVSRLKPGEHAGVFARHCGAWLAAEPDLPVVLVGMAGSREGWALAPYAECPAGVDEIAAALTSIEIGNDRRGVIVPGVRVLEGGRADVLRGEETHLLGSGVTDGLVCLPGTHCKWALLRGGRIASFATFLTGELYALLREHSMVGRPATEPADPAGFSEGLAASPLGGRAAGGGLLNRLFAARAATLTGRLGRERLGTYLSGLLTGEEIAGAFGLFGRPGQVTIVADPPRAELYRMALQAEGIEVAVKGQEETLLAGLGALLSRQPLRERLT